MYRRTVIADHEAIYPDPISVSKGDQLTLGRCDNWDGHIWIWATASNSKEGWVPDDLCSEIDGKAVAERDYCAIELTCKRGDDVIVIHQAHGWAWCRNAKNELGWVPLRNLGGNDLQE